jgi:hypothetical protein
MTFHFMVGSAYGILRFKLHMLEVLFGLLGSRDDNDFIYDSNFRYSLLLPNRTLPGSYQRLEPGGGYPITSRVNVCTNVWGLL